MQDAEKVTVPQDGYKDFVTRDICSLTYGQNILWGGRTTVVRAQVMFEHPRSVI